MRKSTGYKIGFGKKIPAIAAAATAALVLFLLLAFYPQAFRTAGFYVQRGINAFAYYVLGDRPHFYCLVMEKNASDFRVKAGETLDVTYRDEFVVKSVASDDLSGKSVTVFLEGAGSQRNAFGVLFRGIDLVDNLLTGGEIPEGTETAGVYQIVVYAARDKIAVVPVRVVLTPQDWLRFAKNRGNSGEQEEYLKKVAARNREDAGVRKILAGIYLQQNRIGEAAKMYEEILRISPGDVPAMKELARVSVRLGQDDRAIDLLTRLTGIQAQDAEAQAMLGAAYGRKNLWDQAVESYARAVKMDPENYPVRLLLAQAFEKSHRNDAAVEQYRFIISHSPDAAPAWLAMGDMHLRSGQYAQAIESYTRVLAIHPKNAAAHFSGNQ